MTKISFKKKVSKGSCYNQIYIPKSFEDKIQVGDLVEVKLIKKQIELHKHGKNLILSDFKLRLIKNVFSELKKYKKINLVFFVGSFLTQIYGYNDIDLVIILKKQKNNKDSKTKIHRNLVQEFNQNFHILILTEKNLIKNYQKCPVTRTMFANFISNKKIIFEKQKKIDINHIKFLLMMPEDLLKIRVNSKVYLDNLKRLVAIERFLKNKELNITAIEKNITNLIEKKLLDLLKNNEQITTLELNRIRKIMKSKIKNISKIIKNGEKKENRSIN
jgi:hypothetical protein